MEANCLHESWDASFGVTHPARGFEHAGLQICKEPSRSLVVEV